MEESDAMLILISVKFAITAVVSWSGFSDFSK
jgi:hypothetical protein